MAKSRIVFLSGFNTFSGIHLPILKELKKEWEIVSCIDVFRKQIHPIRKYYYLFSNFNLKFDIYKWKKEYYRSLEGYIRSPHAFHRRTKICEYQLNKLKSSYDMIFQLSSMFVPSFKKITKPYVIYIDRTSRMTEKYFPQGLRYKNESIREQYNNLMRYCFDKADKIFTFNEVTRNSVINDYGITPLKVINVNSGVNIPDLFNFTKLHSKLIISVCSDWERQGGRIALDAFKIILEKEKEAEFIIIGKELEEIKIPSRIKIIEYLPFEKLKEFYIKASIVVIPSSLGGMQTMTEAMAFKCVCIGNVHNPYTTNLILHGETGFLTEPNAENLANIIMGILKDKDLQNKVGQRAYEHILKNYTWESAIKLMNIHLKEILKTDSFGIR